MRRGGNCLHFALIRPSFGHSNPFAFEMNGPVLPEGNTGP
jgi:hypothetical protein